MFALATAVSYVLGVVSSLIFPVLGAPGVSALYVAAAIYVPLAIWMGMWGVLAGYISCFFLGLYPNGYSPIVSAVWALADLLEALIPLLFFKFLKVDPDFTVKREWAVKFFRPILILGAVILILGIAIQATLGASYGEPFTTFYVTCYYIGIALASAGVIMGLFVGDPKTWGTYIVGGIILPSIVSGWWGAGSLTIFNFPPPLPESLFWTIFTGWAIGDLIVLSVIGTALLVELTSFIKKTPIYVEGWWA